MGPTDPSIFVLKLLVIFLALGLHEYAHAKMADAAGDPTPGSYGRVTLNLFNHLDPMGTLMIVMSSLVGFGIGWGRPVPMDPRKMRNPRWDHFAAVAAGPVSNLIQAAVFAMILRFTVGNQVFQVGILGVMSGQAGILAAVLSAGVLINLSLCFFNLIPLGPLDGQWLLGTFLPERYRWQWTKWNLQSGTFVLFGILLLGWFTPINILSGVLYPVVMRLFTFLLGLH